MADKEISIRLNVVQLYLKSNLPTSLDSCDISGHHWRRSYNAREEDLGLKTINCLIFVQAQINQLQT